MWKQQVLLYLVGRKHWHQWLHCINKGICSLSPRFHSNAKLYCVEKLSLFYQTELPPAVLVSFFSLHIPHSSWFCGICFSDNDLWSFFNKIFSMGAFLAPCAHSCALVLFLCTFAGLFSQDPWFFSELLQECWKLCPSYISCIWKQVSRIHSSNTSRSLSGNVDGFCWLPGSIL